LTIAIQYDLEAVTVKQDSQEVKGINVPMGVVSKNDNGDRRIPFRAALNIRRLAIKPPTL
jgi:hypothetical protein